MTVLHLRVSQRSQQSGVKRLAGRGALADVVHLVLNMSGFLQTLNPKPYTLNPKSSP